MNTNISVYEDQGEIVLYQPDDSVRIDVRVDGNTVWLTQAQIAELFQKDQSTVARHISNAFREEELNRDSNMQILHNTLSKYKPTAIYDLDVIISVGYRVHSKRGTQFRIWARHVLKDYMLRGYTINSRFSALEDKMERRLSQAESRIDNMQEQIDFFVRTSQPPVFGVFYDGQVFDAYVFVSNLIKQARQQIVLIDNYVDESVLTMLDKRSQGVSAKIYTRTVSQQLALDISRHDAQYPPLAVEPFNRAHDRFLLIDDRVYHVGASVKDIGKKWCAVTLLNDLTAQDIISKL